MVCLEPTRLREGPARCTARHIQIQRDNNSFKSSTGIGSYVLSERKKTNMGDEFVYSKNHGLNIPGI